MKKDDKTDEAMGQKHGVDSKGKEVSGPPVGTKNGVDSKDKGKEVSGSSTGQSQIVTGPSPFDNLPEDCVSNIISFTSPRDACVSCSVSKTFESAVQSDSVWEKFLPPDYTSLAPRSRVFSLRKSSISLFVIIFL